MKNYLFMAMACLLALTSTSFGELVVNAGFETSETTGGGWPNSYGDWNGDYSAIVGATGGITPYEGSQMLQFKGTSHYGAASSTGCCVFQLVDTSSYSSLIASGNAVAKASTFFNRVNTDSQTDTGFYVQIFAFDGLVSTFATRWEANGYSSAIVYSTTNFLTDDLSTTWEKVEGELAIPTTTTFLAISINASENIYNDYSYPEFDGHFADSASLQIVPEPASIIILGSGLIWLSRKRNRAQIK